MLLVLPKNTTVVIGSIVHLSCSYVANPEGEILWQWRNEGSSLTKIDPSSSDRHQLQDNGTLVIRATTNNDSGEYYCTVSNSKGSDTARANLLVISKFTIAYFDFTMLVLNGL